MPTHLNEIKSQPATDELIAQLAEMVQERLAHEHPKPGHGEDFYCLNHTAYMGERMGNVLARLREAEAAAASIAAQARRETAQYFARRMRMAQRAEEDGGSDARKAAFIIAETVAEVLARDAANVQTADA
ncbi:hypothetical protein ACIBQX_11545 [Nonomuraea sp. NPDC049714]|uniref:hypothetical protein n=1 Tax=Nonomuraea sp. NPDC049714 TaxID=3364357 RepID=UPI0037B1DCB4